MSAPTPPRAVFTQVDPATATTADLDGPARRVGPFIMLFVGFLVVVGGIACLVIERAPQFEVIDLATAFACPAGAEAKSDRMDVTASTLNVRAAPSTNADRLVDRTLRKRTTVTEECRAGGWSRVRLVDGRSGWVSNQYLAPATLKN